MGSGNPIQLTAVCCMFKNLVKGETFPPFDCQDEMPQIQTFSFPPVLAYQLTGPIAIYRAALKPKRGLLHAWKHMTNMSQICAYVEFYRYIRRWMKPSRVVAVIRFVSTGFDIDHMVKNNLGPALTG